MKFKALVTMKSGIHITAFFEYPTTEVEDATAFVWRTFNHGVFGRLGTTVFQNDQVEVADVYVAETEE